jgi:molybdopterin-guanine dinucleotide biosynthesis adapter protein
MRVFGIAGFKNAGKTTLVEDLVRELTGRGLRVGTVKHAHHGFDIDQPGKDSHRHRAAGAVAVVVAAPARLALVREIAPPAEPSLRELVALLGDVDIVLVEGYKHGSHPRLEVRRGELGHPELAAGDDRVRAIVTDDPVAGGALPVLRRSAIAAIADFVLANAAAV